MSTTDKKKSDLKKKFDGVTATPASFAFYVAIHDFIEHIEGDATLAKGLSDRIKINKELDITGKYAYLKQIYQGLEDINSPSSGDIGHARYSVIRELSKIKNNDVSESNTFWRKRELFRKLTGLVYDRLVSHLAGPSKAKTTLS